MSRSLKDVWAFVLAALVIIGLVFLAPEILVAVTAGAMYVIELFVIVYLVNIVFDGLEVVL